MPRGWEWDGMGRYWNGIGRAPLAWQLSLPAPSLSPSPFFPSVLVSSDRVRHRKTPSICPPRSYSLSGSDRKGIEGLTEMMAGEGKEGGRV